MPDTDEVGDYTAKQAVEYGTYVAATTITHNGARAYNEGDPVPASNVEKYRYLESGLVRKVGDPVPEPPAPEALPQGEPVQVDPSTEAKD